MKIPGNGRDKKALAQIHTSLVPVHLPSFFKVGYKIKIYNFRETPYKELINALESLTAEKLAAFHCAGRKCEQIELAEALKKLRDDHESRMPKLSAAYHSPLLMINTTSYDRRSGSCVLSVYLQLQPHGISPDTYFTIELQL